MEKKDYLRALLEFRNAARALPGDAEPYYQMGVAYLAANDVRSGYAALKKAVELNPKHRDAQLRLAELLAMTNSPELLRDAESRLKALLADNTGGPEALNALAFTQLQLGDVENAIRSYEAILMQQPGQLSASVMLARTKLAQHDVKGAEELLQKACADAPKSADARRMLAEFYVFENRSVEAEAELNRALGLDGKNGAALLDLGELQLAASRNAEAEQTFRKLRDVDGYRQLFGAFLLSQARNQEAVAEFERLAQADPEDRASRTRLVAVYRSLGRYDDADAALRRALKRNPKDADALLQQGEIALQARKFGDAEVAFNQVLRLRPNAAEAHYLMGKLHKARGDRRLYRQEAHTALTLNPALAPVRAELSRELLMQNDAKAALELLDAAPESQRRYPIIVVQRNWALWALGDLAGMRRGIDLLLSMGSSADGLLQDGVWKLRMGDRKGAREAAEAALKIGPDNVRALSIIQRTYTSQERAVALRQVKEYAVQRPKSPAVQEFLGIVLAGNGNRAEARDAFAAALAADPKAQAARMGLIQLDVADNRLDDAAKQLGSILATDGGNLTARQWLASVEWMRGDKDAAIADFRKVVEANAVDAGAANNLAYLLIEHRNQLDEGLNYAQKAVELAPDRPAYCDTLGWALYRKGLYAEAVKYLQRTEASNADPAWKYHLAMAYAKSGDMERARRALEAGLKQNANTPEAKMAREIIPPKR